MLTFSLGLAAEHRLIALLKIFGCVISTSEFLDDIQKLDFVVIGLPDFPTALQTPLGVQVTLNAANREKRAEFFRRTEKPYVPRNLYLEIPGNLNLENGGAFTVLAVITAFLQDKRFENCRTAAVRVSQDCTFWFYRLVSASISEPQFIVPEHDGRPIPPGTVLSLAPPRLTPNSTEAKSGDVESPPITTASAATTTAASSPASPMEGRSSAVLPEESHGDETIDGEIVEFNPGTGRGIIVDDRQENFVFPQSETDQRMRKILRRAERSKGTFRLTEPMRVTFRVGSFFLKRQETDRVAENIRQRQAPEP